jgi:hypothetical protein
MNYGSIMHHYVYYVYYVYYGEILVLQMERVEKEKGVGSVNWMRNLRSAMIALS